MRHEKVKLRSDGEPTIKSLVRKSKTGGVKSTPLWSKKLLSTVLPAMDVPSVQSKLCDDWQLANSLKVHAELRFKCKLHPSHPGWSWVVRHASWLHNRFHVKANGRTCFEELHQTRYKQDVVPWAEKVLFMEPRPKHRRLKGGRRAQKMGAAMEPGIWLGRTEESDEHLVGTARGVLRARTVRRMTPDKRWDSELFFGFRGVPWDVTADALPAKPRSKVMVHFTMPSSEVVPQPDGSNLTHGGDAVEPQAVGEDRSSGYAPTTPLGRSEPGDVGFESPAEGEESPSRAAGYLTPASPRSPSHKRQGSEPDRPTKTQVVEDESPGQGSKSAELTLPLRHWTQGLKTTKKASALKGQVGYYKSMRLWMKPQHLCQTKHGTSLSRMTWSVILLIIRTPGMKRDGVRKCTMEKLVS